MGRIYTRRCGGKTFGMGAPELRRKIVEHAERHGIPITLSFLRQFTHTDFLYGAMRAAQSGHTSHPIFRRWFEECQSPNKSNGRQMTLPI